MLCILTLRGCSPASGRHIHRAPIPSSMQRRTRLHIPSPGTNTDADAHLHFTHIAKCEPTPLSASALGPFPCTLSSVAFDSAEHLPSILPSSEEENTACTDVNANLDVDISPALYQPAKRCPRPPNASRRLIETRCESRIMHPFFDPNHTLDRKVPFLDCGYPKP
jgi:hypothetical protein